MSATIRAPSSLATFHRCSVHITHVQAPLTRVHAAKLLEGKVVSTKMNKTVTVLVQRYQLVNKKYGKRVLRNKKYMVHDEEEACEEGDYVSIVSGTKRSKHKSFELARIIRKVVKL